MDVVAIGTNQPAYVEEILPSDYEICWDYKSLNTNSEYGLALLQKHYGYQALGVLMKPSSAAGISQGIVQELLGFYLGKTESCPFFDFLEALAPILTEEKACCLSFSASWQKAIPVRLKAYTIAETKAALNNFSSWREVFYLLKEELTIPYNNVPLLIELKA